MNNSLFWQEYLELREHLLKNIVVFLPKFANVGNNSFSGYSKAYLANEVVICVEFSLLIQGHENQYVVFLNHANFSAHDTGWLNRQFPGDGILDTVLIRIRESIENEQGIHLSVAPFVIRLYRLNDLNGIWGNEPKPILEGCIIPLFEDGETNINGRVVFWEGTIQTGKFPDQIIKASDETAIIGRWTHIFYPDNMLPALQVIVSNNFVGLTFLPSPQLVIKFSQVQFCPIEAAIRDFQRRLMWQHRLNHNFKQYSFKLPEPSQVVQGQIPEELLQLLSDMQSKRDSNA